MKCLAHGKSQKFFFSFSLSNSGVGMGGSMLPEGNIDYVKWRRER